MPWSRGSRPSNHTRACSLLFHPLSTAPHSGTEVLIPQICPSPLLVCGLVCPQHQWQFHWGQGRVACFLFHISTPASAVQHDAGHGTETPEMFRAELTSCSLSISVTKKVYHSMVGAKMIPQRNCRSSPIILTFIYRLLNVYYECWLNSWDAIIHSHSNPQRWGFYNCPRLEGQGQRVENEVRRRQP